jgi:hypothetical protein
LFYLADNGVTVLCPEAAVGDAREVNGVLYTKRDRAALDALVTANPTDQDALARSCTSGVTDMSELFGDPDNFVSKASDPATFNPDLSSWDTSSVTNMEYMFYVRVPPYAFCFAVYEVDALSLTRTSVLVSLDVP